MSGENGGKMDVRGGLSLRRKVEAGTFISLGTVIKELASCLDLATIILFAMDAAYF
jgi:hypothetical protein